MELSDQGKYFQVLTSIIQVNRVVPFSCYILLRANNRIVRLVPAGIPFTQEILDKLAKFKIDQIFVHEDEKAEYAKYLRGFFQTVEGQTVLQDLQQKSSQGVALEGIPEELTRELQLTAPEGSTESQTKVSNENERLRDSQKASQDLNRRWQEFQGKVFKKMTDQERLAAKDFGVQLQTASTLQEDAKHQAERVEKDSELLCESVGVTKETFSTSKRPAGLVLPGEKGTLTAEEQLRQAEAMKRASEALVVPPESGEDADTETLRTENQVLRSQLGDAKSLLIKTNEKVIELQAFMDRSTSYISELEKEHGDMMKDFEKLRSQLQNLETANQNLTDMAGTAQKIATRAKNVIQDHEQRAQRLKERVQTLEEELKLFKEKFAGIDPDELKKKYENPDEDVPLPSDVVALLKQKDREIAKLLSDLEQLDKAYKISDRNVNQLKARIEDSALLKKRMAQRFERLEAEKEEWRRKHDQLDRRLIALNNILEKERRAVSRLSTIAEELKKDRVEFMNKTNGAMKAHKEALSKTNSLNNAVQKEMERNRKLQEQVKHFKDKVQEVTSMLNQAQTTAKTLEAELRRYRKAA